MKKILFISRHKHDRYDDQSVELTYWYGVFEKLNYEVIYQDAKNINWKTFYKQVADYNPDYIFTFDVNAERVEMKNFNTLREIGKLYLIQTDMIKFYHIAKLWFPYIDGIINYEGLLDRCIQDGLPENKFLKIRWGFNPNTMVFNQSENKEGIYHYGGLHGGRHELLINLKNKYNIDVSVTNDINYQQVKQYLQNSKYSLSFSMGSTLERRELKGRVIEIPAHSVMLSETAPDIELYYDETEYINFKDLSELSEKIKYYDNNTEEYLKILHNGKKAIWDRNTIYHEMNQLLPKIDDDFNPIDVKELLKENYKDYYYE